MTEETKRENLRFLTVNKSTLGEVHLKGLSL